GHAPTGVAWTAPEDVSIDISLDAWKLRNNANTYITVWVNGEKRIDKALIPIQSETCNSEIPYTLAQMLEEGGSGDSLQKISLKQGEQVIVEIGGNDYAGIDLSIKSDRQLWELDQDFSYEHNANDSWSYGQVTIGTDSKPEMVFFDTVISEFNPDGKAQFGVGQPAWISKELPAHLSMIKSLGRTPSSQELRHVSGTMVYTEALIEDRWVGRHWSSDGTFKIGYEGFLQNAFVIEIDHQRLEAGWRMVSTEESEDAGKDTRHTVINLSHKGIDIDVAIHSYLDGTQIITRWLEITNTGDQAVALTDLAPWAGRLVTHQNFWATPNPPKRYEYPFALGYFSESDHSWEGRFKWHTFQEAEVLKIGCHKGQCYDDPFFIIRSEGTGQHLIAHLEWSANWDLNAEYHDDGADTLVFRIGPWASEALRVIAPNETVKTPAVHFGLLAEDLDTTVQAMHEHIRRSVFPKRDAARANLIQYALPGDQGYLSQNFGDSSGYTVESIRKNIDIAAAIGAELFIMDAGWWDIQGDWEPSVSRFPDGLKPLSDYARENNMLFGLYGEIEKSSSASRVGREHPEWIEWYEPFPVLNLADPQAAAHMEKELTHIIEDFGLDLFRLDFNTPSFEVKEGKSFLRQGIEENNFWRYYDSFADIFQRIHEKYPNLILQQAACGGGRNDLATVRRFHENYLTDGSRLPFETQNYAGQSMAIPPENFIIAHGADGGGPTGHAENFETNLRTVFTLSTPWIFAGTVAPDLDSISPHRLERYRHYVALYKEFIRPILPTSRVYHHAPISARGGVESNGFFAMEFFAPDRSRGWATLVRIGPSDTDVYVFKPRGLDRGKTYKVTFDGTSETVFVDGLSLVRDGLPIRLEILASSELLLFEMQE
ncbi:MAG: alpha-galactosidase, partial [Candidatus Hydrogenedentes bacterium]|nr:alpha-galactosidase [Candidatus Hydrogenedentota bacterium]